MGGVGGAEGDADRGSLVIVEDVERLRGGRRAMRPSRWRRRRLRGTTWRWIRCGGWCSRPWGCCGRTWRSQWLQGRGRASPAHPFCRHIHPSTGVGSTNHGGSVLARYEGESVGGAKFRSDIPAGNTLLAFEEGKLRLGASASAIWALN